MSVCPFVRIGQLGFYCMNFHEVWQNIFRKSAKRVKLLLKPDNSKGILYVKTNIRFLSHLTYLLLEWEIFCTKIAEKVKTNVLCSVTFVFLKSCRWWNNVKKYCRADRPLRLACWVPKATDTHSEYITFTAFPLQQRLHKRVSVFPYVYIASLCFVYMQFSYVEESRFS
jgi:hypothetical protein